MINNQTVDDGLAAAGIQADYVAEDIAMGACLAPNLDLIEIMQALLNSCRKTTLWLPSPQSSFV